MSTSPSLRGCFSAKRSSEAILLTLALVLPACGFSVLAAPVQTMASSPSQQRESTAVRSAMRRIEARDFEGAERILRAQIEAHPEDLDARLALGNLYVQLGTVDAALSAFQEVLRLHPRAPAAELALGTIDNRNGRSAEAEPLLRDAVRQAPTWAEARLELAFTLAKLHKYADAELVLRELRPPAGLGARVRYYRLSASIHSGLGDAKRSARDMEQALTIAPSDDALRLAVAIAEAGAAEWASCLRNAAAVYKAHPAPASGLVLVRAQLATRADAAPTLQSLRALGLPDDQELALRTELARVLSENGLHREAVEDLERAIALSRPAAGLLYNLALEQFRAGQLDAAFSTLSRLKTLGDSAETEDLAGDVEEQRGNYLEAARRYQNAVELAPGEEKYRISFGLELLRHESFEPAAAVFRQAAKLFPVSARIQLLLGTTLYFLQLNSESVAAFVHAAELDPRSEDPIRCLGMTQTQNLEGPARAAVDSVCHRAKANPNDSVAVLWCGALLFRQAYLEGDTSKASEIVGRLQMAERMQPGDANAACQLGRALAWVEQWKAARKSLETCVRLRPGSEEDHMRLARVYKEAGLPELALRQARVLQNLKRNNAEESQEHESAARTFIYQLLDQPETSRRPR